MTTTTLVLTVIAVFGTIAVGAWLWWGFSHAAPDLLAGGPPAPLPPRPDPAGPPDEGEDPAPAGGIPRPDLEDPKVAAADALVRRWYAGRLGGPRGLAREERESRIQRGVEEQGLTPGLAAAAAYDRWCRERRLTPKRPPAEVRAALTTLGVGKRRS